MNELERLKAENARLTTLVEELSEALISAERIDLLTGHERLS